MRAAALLALALSFALSETGDAALAAPRVPLTVFTEIMWPDCENYVGGGAQFRRDLNDTFSADGVAAILDLQIVPWGNAAVERNGSFTCQHGPNECAGDAIEACVLGAYRDQSVFFPFAQQWHHAYNARCTREGTPAGQCGLRLAKEIIEGLRGGISWERVAACVGGDFDDAGVPPRGSEAYELSVEAAKRTDALRPKHTSVPWVTLGHAPNSPVVSDAAQQDTLCVVCGAYTGAAPPGCAPCATDDDVDAPSAPQRA